MRVKFEGIRNVSRGERQFVWHYVYEIIRTVEKDIYLNEERRGRAETERKECGTGTNGTNPAEIICKTPKSSWGVCQKKNKGRETRRTTEQKKKKR
jgi:hypothetical protein